MPQPRRLASIAALLALTACGPRGHTDAYLQACHGEPLLGAEAREAAMVEGYVIYPGYECITKESWAAVQEEKAQRAAANTPEAIAKREKERIARYEQAAAERAAPAEPAPYEPFEPADVSPVDANTASESELAQVISVGPEVAAQIIAARNERPFADWSDLVLRVVGLSAAWPAVQASICGLVVNGESLSGAPPDAMLAAQIREKFRAYE
jgi:DNA uptake protein ComE-like DNA-binding protein